MNKTLVSQIPLWVILLLVLVEMTMWFDCYQTTEIDLDKDRFIATSASCNEEAEIYRNRLDCADIKRSLKSGTAWIRSSSCLLKKHNFFAVLGWVELTIVGGTAVLLFAVWAFFYLNVRQQNSFNQHLQSMLHYQNNGRLSLNSPVRQSYRNGVAFVEEIE